jgi:hypothetical protein
MLDNRIPADASDDVVAAATAAAAPTLLLRTCSSPQRSFES